MPICVEVLGRVRSGLPFAALVIAVATTAILAGCGPSRDSVTPEERPKALADSLTLSRTDLTIYNIEELNSRRDDFGVSMGLDTHRVWLTSSRNGPAKAHAIYGSTRKNGEWQDAWPAPEINADQSTGMPTVLPGEQIMYLTRCNLGFGDCDLYRVESGPRGSLPKTTIPWTIPRNLGLEINGSYWDSQPCIASDGSLLVFASDRPGGFGGRDIWVSIRNQYGQWSPPINAGERINTVFDEMTPWLSPDLKTLYFASNGHAGIGGYDLYAVPLDPRGGWQPTDYPEILAEPVNSSADDIALSLSADGTKAFFASNRSGGQGGYDIYGISDAPVPVAPLAVVTGRVTDAAGTPVMSRIEVRDLWNGNVIGVARTEPETGSYALVLRPGADFGITATAPDYLFNTRRLTVGANLTETRNFTLKHVLQPMDGTVQLMLFFEPASSTLERESLVELERVVTFMRANPEVRIEIGGHTDNIGDPLENQRLSLDRAKAAKAHLVGNRIDGDRIEVKGYGDTKPIADNETDAGREMNRRIEMRVIN